MNFWKHPLFFMILQEYDGYDCYISVLEIRAKEPLILPVRTHRHDLHWLYLLKGFGVFKKATELTPHSFSLSADEHLQIYCGPQENLLEVETGHFLLIVFQAKGGWLSRYRYGLTNEVKELIGFLRNKAYICSASKKHAISGLMQEKLLTLLLLPIKADMAMDVIIGQAVSDLIQLVQGKAIKNNPRHISDAKISTFRRLVILHLETNQLPTVARLAELLHISSRYLLTEYRKRYPETPQQYIIEMRLIAASKRLLTGKQSIMQITYDLGYSEPSVFSKQFKKHFGLSPRAYLKREQDKKRDAPEQL